MRLAQKTMQNNDLRRLAVRVMIRHDLRKAIAG